MGRSYPHLSLAERRKIAQWRDADMPVSEIADRLGRAPSTIYRELKRSDFSDPELPKVKGYFAVAAQDMYERRRETHRKMVRQQDLKAAIEDRLKAGLLSANARIRLPGNGSPEQIAGRMRL